MRKYLLLYINGIRYEVTGKEVLKNLSQYLRENLGLIGTKVVCSEGDCGACTVLVHRYFDKQNTYSTTNSCILPLYLLDCCHIITIEGIGSELGLHPVQEAIAKHHGTQCGFCTPGIVNALVSMTDNLILHNKKVDIKKVKNYTTGNLCRCTGYKGIIDAALSLDLSQITPTYQRYYRENIEDEFKEAFTKMVELYIKEKDIHVVLPKSIEDLIILKSQGYLLISGGTDLGVLMNKSGLCSKKIAILTNIESLYEIENNDKYISFAAAVNLRDVENHCKQKFPEFSNALHLFASPQIKNRATLVGNIANGSPIGDTLPFLYVSDARLVLVSFGQTREVLLSDFYLGYKQFDLVKDEVISKVIIPISDKVFKIYKVSARKDLDISAVSLAVSYRYEKNILKEIGIAYGGVAATVYKAKEIEKIFFLKGINNDSLEEAVKLIPSLITPLSDHRSSKEYRIKLCQNLLRKFFDEMKIQSKVS